MTNSWAFLVGVNRHIDPNFATLRFCVNHVLESNPQEQTGLATTT